MVYRVKCTVRNLALLEAMDTWQSAELTDLHCHINKAVSRPLIGSVCVGTQRGEK